MLKRLPLFGWLLLLIVGAVSWWMYRWSASAAMPEDPDGIIYQLSNQPELITENGLDTLLGYSCRPQWDTTQVLQWSVNHTFTYTWDRSHHFLFIESGSAVCFRELSTARSAFFWKGKQVKEGRKFQELTSLFGRWSEHLYWLQPLKDLPHPGIDFRSSEEDEMTLSYFAHPWAPVQAVSWPLEYEADSVVLEVWKTTHTTPSPVILSGWKETPDGWCFPSRVQLEEDAFFYTDLKALPFRYESMLPSYLESAVFEEWQSDSLSAEATTSDSFLLGGIQVNEANADYWTNRLQKVGMNTVSVTVYARQKSWRTGELDFEPADTTILEEIRMAKKKGLKVVLILRVYLDWYWPENRFFWHGMIFPETEGDLADWFFHYGLFVSYWSDLAEREGVDVLAVGSELNNLAATLPADHVPDLQRFYLNRIQQEYFKKQFLRVAPQLDPIHWALPGRIQYKDPQRYIEERQQAYEEWANVISFADQPQQIKAINHRRDLLRQYWIDLITQSRVFYSGQLSFAANFDNYQEIGFWDYLDLLGINAYFLLRYDQPPNTTQAQRYATLKKGWQDVFDQIDAFKAEQDLQQLPILFTELGYTHRRNSTLAPWEQGGYSILLDYTPPKLMLWSQEPSDFIERALAVRALHATHRQNPQTNLQGILYWKLTTQHYHLPIEPFSLYIGPNTKDPLLNQLQLFQ
jgi:hypothetical protein